MIFKHCGIFEFNVHPTWVKTLVDCAWRVCGCWTDVKKRKLFSRANRLLKLCILIDSLIESEKYLGRRRKKAWLNSKCTWKNATIHFLGHIRLKLRLEKLFFKFFGISLFLKCWAIIYKKSGEFLSSQKKSFTLLKSTCSVFHIVYMTFENFCVNERRRTRRERKFYDLENFGVWHKMTKLH